MASTRTLQTAANALRLGAYRTGVASSSSLLRTAAPRAARQSASAPRCAVAALPSGIRRYSQKQPGESKIWSFEEVCCALARLYAPPLRQFRPRTETRHGERDPGGETGRHSDRLADELSFPAHRSRSSHKNRNPMFK